MKTDSILTLPCHAAQSDGVLGKLWVDEATLQVISTTRDLVFGMSEAPYARCNLASHVGDSERAVRCNREALAKQLGGMPLWLDQVHGTDVFDANGDLAIAYQQPPKADAAWTMRRDVILAVLTADCLPIVVWSDDYQRVGVAHAGWRGLLRGVIPALMRAMQLDPSRAVGLIGPAIRAQDYEVDAVVRLPFLQEWGADTDRFFEPVTERSGHWWADLPGLARWQLTQLGCSRVFDSGANTADPSQPWFSWRRERITGRLATLARLR